MSAFPQIPSYPDPSILVSTLSNESFGSTPITATFTAAAWPTANLAYFVPFRLTRPTTFSTMFIYEGTGTISGNIDLGIYSVDGTRLVHTGSTANVSTGAQSISITSTEFGVGTYYFAAACDNTTNQEVFMQPSNVNFCKALGMAQAATSFVLPATVTFATMVASNIPIIGATNRSFV